MGVDKDIKEIVGLAGRQAVGFIAVLKLKIRIIGFSNKRSGIMTKLGELAFKAYEQDKPFKGDEAVKKLIEEIGDADNEIKLAEDSIVSQKEQDLTDRRGFQEKRREQEEMEKESPLKDVDVADVVEPDKEGGKERALPDEDTKEKLDASDGVENTEINEPEPDQDGEVKEASPKKEVENKKKSDK